MLHDIEVNMMMTAVNLDFSLIELFREKKFNVLINVLYVHLIFIVSNQPFQLIS